MNPARGNRSPKWNSIFATYPPARRPPTGRLVENPYAKPLACDSVDPLARWQFGAVPLQGVVGRDANGVLHAALLVGAARAAVPGRSWRGAPHGQCGLQQLRAAPGTPLAMAGLRHAPSSAFSTGASPAIPGTRRRTPAVLRPAAVQQGSTLWPTHTPIWAATRPHMYSIRPARGSLHESWRLRFRSGITNGFNYVNIDNPTTSTNSSTFGQITGAGAMRQVQVGLRLNFR